MQHRVVRIWLVLLVALSGIFAAALPAGAAAPGLRVSLDGVGLLGRFDQAIVSGQVRCPAGSTDVRLALQLTQGGDVGTHSISGFTCDGNWHRFTTSLGTDPWGGPFGAGQSWLQADLTGVAANGRTLAPASDANGVWLRPSAKVVPIWPVVLHRDGSLTVTVAATCRGPWAASSVSVMVARLPVSGVDASAYVESPDVPCDGQPHRVRLSVDAPPSVRFVPGPVHLNLNFQIWDEADTGDPINGVSWEGVVRIERR